MDAQSKFQEYFEQRNTRGNNNTKAKNIRLGSQLSILRLMYININIVIEKWKDMDCCVGKTEILFMH